MQQLLTVEDTAKALNISVSTLRDWIQYRRIPFIRLGRCIRFRPEDLERIQKEGLRTNVK
ncbi:MAG: helix-turn-helix domain-containing protein [Planctomycetota bacterium]|jgi:excisionase family DNA binding protein